MIKYLSRTSLILAVLFATSAFVSCGGGEEQADPNQEAIAKARSLIQDLNYSPNGKGFGYKKTKVPEKDFKEWLAQFKPQLNDALNAIAPGFALQVTGHTDSIGPRFPEGSKKGNVFYSTERAKGVYEQMIKEGLPQDKLTYKGIADDEALPGTQHMDARNRRVTFKIVQKEAEEGAK